jgi:starch-binding outer membrane protein, SusD/RagB family
MKSYKKLTLTLGIFLLCTLSCKKDILVPQISDQFAENNFLKTEADIQSAVTSYYSLFGTDWGAADVSTNNYIGSFNVSLGGLDWVTSQLTDQMYHIGPGPFLGLYAFGPASFESKNQQVFYSRIQFVARATQLIDLISKLEGVNQQVKNQYLGEMKCMRAWLMWILYDLYGPLNPILDPAKLADKEMQPRMTSEAYLKSIETDLLDAIALIPVVKYNADASNWGRISKAVASMVLLKMYVNTAKTTADWQKAKALGTTITTMGFSLLPSYKNIFLNKANSELIYAVPGNSGTANWWFNTVIPNFAINVAGIATKKGWSCMGMPWEYYDKYQVGDKRLETIADKCRNEDGVMVTRDNGLLCAIPIKYLKYVDANAGFDWVMFRYSDVLLYMAEITNQLDGPTPEAMAYLKQITDRAGVTISTNPAIDPTLSKEKFRDYVIEERGKELYLENGNRRQDLIRVGKLISNARLRGKSNAEPRHVLFPIPSDVINTSNGIIAQNPGYEN